MTVTVDTSLSPLLAVRELLATRIETDTGYTCHPSMETALATPCVVLTGDGWVPLMSNADPAYRIQVTCLYANQAGDLADGVEELARLVYLACVDFGCKVPADVPGPGSVTVGSHDYAGVQFTATLLVTIRSI